jgi:hypothetical protein
VTVQLLAIGNLNGNGAVQNLTNTVTWISSDSNNVSVSPTGLTISQVDPAYGLTGGSTITAIGTTASGSVITSSVVVTVVSDQTTAPVTVVPTLTVSTIGTGSGTVVGISGTTQVIDCGNGGTTCNQNLATGTAVTLTATPAAGSTFVNWTNCTTTSGTTCTLTVSNDVTVTATFNQ